MRPHLGITLVELLATIVVLGVTLAIGTPSYLHWVEQAHATRAANLTHAFLMSARTHAITSGRRVVVCRSNDGHSCTYVGAWSAGSMAFIDHRGNGVREVDEEVLAVLNRSELAPFHVVGPSNRRLIGFKPDGRNAGTNLTLRVCDRRMIPRRLVIVSIPGRVRTSREVDGVARCGSDPPPVY